MLYNAHFFSEILVNAHIWQEYTLDETYFFTAGIFDVTVLLAVYQTVVNILPFTHRTVFLCPDSVILDVVDDKNYQSIAKD